MAKDIDVLQRQLLKWSLLNLVMVAASGLILRAWPLMNGMPFVFKNALHAHSHFAFGGWVLPIITWLIMRYFPVPVQKLSFHHWRNIIVLMLFSSYGMLVSFPFNGYDIFSIIFSTISLGASVYLAIVLWKAMAGMNSIAVKYLRAALVFMILSSIGPLSTGPLIATGMAGTTLYFNAIYFYLHFQYNGWFTFALLAVLYQFAGIHSQRMAALAFVLLTAGCTITFFLSVLWNSPGIFFNISGAAGAILQLAGFYFLCRSIKISRNGFTSRLIILALTVLGVKFLLQLAGSLPIAASMAYENRNLIIAFLHMVLLGFVSMLSIAFIPGKEKQIFHPRFKTGTGYFIFSLVSTELLLVGNTVYGFYGGSLVYFNELMVIASIPFLAGACMIFHSVVETRLRLQSILSIRISR